MDATAVPIADAGSNTQTQPSQLLLYLPASFIQNERRGLQSIAHKHDLDTRLYTTQETSCWCCKYARIGRGDEAAVLMSQMRMPPSPPPLITCGEWFRRVLKVSQRTHMLRMHFTPTAVKHSIICRENGLATASNQ
jgi:hypothetical protein